MKILEICYRHGHGFQAHFSNDQQADQALSALHLSMEKHGGEAGVRIVSDDVDVMCFPVPQDISFIQLTSVESSALMAEDVETTFNVTPPRRH